MIRSNVPLLAGGLFMVFGLLLAGFGFRSLSETEAIRSDLNPMALQKSAYGKLMARLSETTVDRVWHLGVEQIVPHIISGEEHDHDHDHHAGHDHSEHHEHHEHHEAEEADEEFVYHVGEDDEGEDHHHDHSGCSGCPDCPDEAPTLAEESEPPIERAKLWLNRLRFVKYDRTNPKGLNEAHLMTVKKDVEKLLLRSYKLDPLHYGAYNSYHLFLTTHEYGGNEQTMEKARLVANLTMKEAAEENEDPEAQLTGAAAAYNLFHMAADHYRASGARMPLGEVRQHQKNISFFLDRFESFQERAVEAGTWENLSFERQREINERYTFASRSFEQFDAMLARFADPKPSIEEDVANMLELEGF